MHDLDQRGNDLCTVKCTAAACRDLAHQDTPANHIGQEPSKFFRRNDLAFSESSDIGEIDEHRTWV